MIPARNYRHARESGHPGRAGTAFAAPGPPLPRGRQKKRRWEPSVWFIPLDAAKLWHIYRATIDVSAGISPGGPAVRFIRAVLVRMGYRRLPKHIESALRDPVNWPDEYLRRRFDEVMI